MTTKSKIKVYKTVVRPTSTNAVESRVDTVKEKTKDL